MAFIKFNKEELVNLSYSLKREIILANKTGACCNTTIVACNTRRYHGLLAVPIDNFKEEKHVLLSSLDESISVEGKYFNLGIHRYGKIYEPKGHKYIVDFNYDPIPEITYRVGDIVIVKSILLVHDEDRVMIKYEVRESPSSLKLNLKPFLAFRHIHALTKQNDSANRAMFEIESGAAFKMYDGFPFLNMQLSDKKSDFKYDPHWYHGITYIDEARRGFESTEDLWVPGIFVAELREGDSIVFSAGVEPLKASVIKRKFNECRKRSTSIDNYRDQLLKCADLLIRERNGKHRITSGFSWLYTGQFRETLYSIAGLTLYADGNCKKFESILDNLINDNQERLYKRTTQVEAPLMISHVLQEYIKFGADPDKVWKKYGGVVKNVLESYLPGIREEISLHPNGLLWAQKYRTSLNWMDAYIDGIPVTERAGYQVETNAYWYNSICFALEMEQRAGKKADKAFMDKWTGIKLSVLENYRNVFLIRDAGYLADYVDNDGQNRDVRPNQMVPVWLPFSPVKDEDASVIMRVIANELVTKRGIRTLSPRNVKYKGVYEGSQAERDAAYHQGSTRPFLLYQYVDINFRMMGKAFYKKAEWLIEGFYDDLNKHGVGAFAELYDGDPPHEPHGAISSALSTSALLGVYYLIKKYKEDGL